METKKQAEITLALPTYNEQDNIQKVINNSVKTLDEQGRTWEIIVIDNFSSDNTTQVVSSLIDSTNLPIRLIKHNENKLYSGSCRTAIQNAQGKYIAIMDSDGQFFASDLPKFIDKLETGINLVFGWRRKRNDPFFRLLMSWLFNLLAKLWLKYPLHDLNVGLRMFDRKFADVAEIRHTINMSNPELFVRAKIAKMNIDEVEIKHSERTMGKTSHNLLKIGRIFFCVNKYMRQLRREMKSK